MTFLIRKIIVNRIIKRYERDSNFIENVWARIKTKVAVKKPMTLQELWQATKGVLYNS